MRIIVFTLFSVLLISCYSTSEEKKTDRKTSSKEEVLNSLSYFKIDSLGSLSLMEKSMNEENMVDSITSLEANLPKDSLLYFILKIHPDTKMPPYNKFKMNCSKKGYYLKERLRNEGTLLQQVFGRRASLLE
ncbi:MAG: hypothetical protein QNL21_06015 [Flavobacteriales bacterium]